MGLLPVVAYGLISVSQGWYFLPNPLYLKEPVGDVGTRALQIIRHLLVYPYLSLASLAGLLLGIQQIYRRRQWSTPVVAVVIFSTTTAIHLVFARTGWFYRYESYLLPMAVVTIGAVAFQQRLPAFRPGYARAAGWSLIGVIGMMGVLALVERGLNSFRDIPDAVRNIYEQQYQMARFLREFYEGADVVANDIGAINYLADIHNLDSYGLGSLDVLQAKLEGRYDSAELSRLAAGSQIAIVYEGWLYPLGGAPSNWTLVGQWTIENLSIVSEDTVSFYAIDPAERQALMRNLRAFAGQLPATVTQAGAYVVAAG
jgi:hypothetical protein